MDVHPAVRCIQDRRADKAESGGHVNEFDAERRKFEVGSVQNLRGKFVLAVFPDSRDQTALRRFLSFTDITLVTVRNYAEVCANLNNRGFDVVVTDIELPCGHSWRNVLDAARIVRGIPTIVADRLADESRWAAALDSGCYDLVVKPFEASELRRVLSLACGADTLATQCYAGAGAEAAEVMARSCDQRWGRS